MATWSSFEKDRLLAENWRKFVKDNPEDKSSQTVFGINSKDNPESLKSFLKKNQGAIGLNPKQVDRLVALMLAQTKEDDVVLEAIGGPQRDARTFSSETTTKLNTLIDSFDLGAANKKKLEKVLNRWAKLNTVSFEQGAASAPAPTPAEPPPTEEPKQTSGGIDYEPHDATDATPEKRADNLVVKPSSTDVPDEAEAETDRIEPVSSTRPTKKPDEKTPAQTAVDLLNRIEGSEQPEITVELFNNFVRDLKSFIGEINKQKRKVSEITIKQISTKLGLKPYKFTKFIKENEKYRPIVVRLQWAQEDENVLNSFLTAFEQVAKSLPAEPAPQAAPEPAEEEEPKQKTTDPRLARRMAFKIKRYYNDLEIGKKLTNKFNIWKEPIERLDGVQSIEKFEFDKAGEKSGKSVETFDTDKDGLYLITLTNGEQFGLPKQAFNSSIEFAFEENGTSVPGKARLKDVITLAKIEDGKIIKKGLVKYDDSMKESLMLRWKTIAGIK